jgi:hypothetical protein
MPWSSTVM